MRRPCLKCGVLTANGSFCPPHQPVKRLSPSSRATDKAGWKKLRALALQRDGDQCVRCGATDHLAAHHILAVYQGGRNILSNVQTLCGNCHRAAHKPPQRHPAAS